MVANYPGTLTLHRQAKTSHTNEFDFNENGRIDFNDIVKLFGRFNLILSQHLIDE